MNNFIRIYLNAAHFSALLCQFEFFRLTSYQPKKVVRYELPILSQFLLTLHVGSAQSKIEREFLDAAISIKVSQLKTILSARNTITTELFGRTAVVKSASRWLASLEFQEGKNKKFKLLYSLNTIVLDISNTSSIITGHWAVGRKMPKSLGFIFPFFKFTYHFRLLLATLNFKRHLSTVLRWIFWDSIRGARLFALNY